MRDIFGHDSMLPFQGAHDIGWCTGYRTDCCVYCGASQSQDVAVGLEYTALLVRPRSKWLKTIYNLTHPIGVGLNLTHPIGVCKNLIIC